MKPHYSPQSSERYADTPTPLLPRTQMTLEVRRLELVVIDPQVDVTSPKGPPGRRSARVSPRTIWCRISSSSSLPPRRPELSSRSHHTTTISPA